MARRWHIRFHHWQFDVDVPRRTRGAMSVSRSSARAAFEDWYRDRAAAQAPASRRTHRRPPRRAPDADPRSGPAQALGELRARRHAPLQLAHRHGAAGPRRLRRRARTGAPAGARTRARVLGSRRAGCAGLPPAARAASRGWAETERVSAPRDAICGGSAVVGAPKRTAARVARACGPEHLARRRSGSAEVRRSRYNSVVWSMMRRN